MFQTSPKTPLFYIGGEEFANGVSNAALDLVTSNVYILAPVALSYFYGYGLLYLLFLICDVPKKPRKVLKSIAGKVVLGFMWEAFITLIIYPITYGSFDLQPRALQDIELTVIIVSFALQFILSILFTFITREKQRKKDEEKKARDMEKINRKKGGKNENGH